MAKIILTNGSELFWRLREPWSVWRLSFYPLGPRVSTGYRAEGANVREGTAAGSGSSGKGLKSASALQFLTLSSPGHSAALAACGPGRGRDQRFPHSCAGNQMARRRAR